MLDGTDNNSRLEDFLTGTSYVLAPPPEAIQEFRLENPTYSSAIGITTGPALNVAIKSGSSKLHADLWEFFANDYTNAADFFDNANNIKGAGLRKNQYGASLGGPLAIPHFTKASNKTFFFADYEGQRADNFASTTGTVPTPLELSGDFSQTTCHTFYFALIESQPIQKGSL